MRDGSDWLRIGVWVVAGLALTAPTLAATESVAQTEHMLALKKAVNADRIKQDVVRLAGFGTRHTLSDTLSDVRGIGAARRWIEAEFQKISAACGGCLTVVVDGRVFSGEPRIPEPTEVVNVVALLRGQTEPNRYVMMTGDIDSRVSDPLDAASDSPGANDNATGMAGVLEAARVLSRHKFSATLVFAGLSGEEQGLFGGQVLAEQARKNNWFVEAVLNNDMIGNIEGINGVVDNTTVRVFSEATRAIETEEERRLRRFTGGEVDSPSRNLARYIDQVADRYFENLDVMMIYRLDRFGRGGHHRPFNEVGFPAVRIMETNEHYHRQHQDLRNENGTSYGDVVAGVNFDYARRVTALNVLTLASLAKAPAPPARVTIEGQVSPDTTLRWQRVPGATNYRLHWRLTTDANWRFSRLVGDQTEATLSNVVIDNYIFGVSSIGSEGFESPVVFPGPIGRFRYP